MLLEHISLILYSLILAAIFIIDLKRRLILDIVTYPAMVLTLLVAILGGDIIGTLIGGIIGFGFYFGLSLIMRNRIGIGDIKLGALIGLMVGYPVVVIAIVLAWVIGGIASVLILTVKHKEIKGDIPFGPFMATAAIITLLWGNDIWRLLAW